MGYLKKCWYRIRSLTYDSYDTIKLVSVKFYYCTAQCVLPLKQHYYLYPLLKVECSLRKEVSVITDLVRAPDQISA